VATKDPTVTPTAEEAEESDISTEGEPAQDPTEEVAEEEAKKPTAISGKGDHLAAFLKASGYKESAVDGQNNKTRTFVTTNGGKYQLLKSGKVRTLSGPAYPKEVAGEE